MSPPALFKRPSGATLPEPDGVDTRSLMLEAIALHRTGRRHEARALYRRVLVADPAQADALHLTGLAELQDGHPQRALDWFERSLLVVPDHVDALIHRGTALRALGRPDDALNALDHAVNLAPRQATAFNARAAVLLDLGRPEEALPDLDRCLALRPGLPEALFNRGHTLARLGRDREALAACRAALAGLPDNATLLNEIGTLLRRQGLAREALEHFERGLGLAPGHAALWVNRGHALAESGLLEAAADSYRHADSLEPDLPLLAGHRLLVAQQTSDWATVDALLPRVTAGLTADGTDRTDHVNRSARADRAVCEPFVALLSPLTAAQQRRCAEQHARAFAPQPWRAPVGTSIGTSIGAPAGTPGRKPGASPALRPLRIGYYSADFKEHPTAQLVTGVLEQHDRRRVEVFGFSLGPAGEDPARLRVRAAVDQFVDVAACTDQEVVDLSQALEIDIAVDLGGWTRGCRGGIFARRAAPVQAGWLGFAGTTGSAAIDYLVADAVVAPPGSEAEFSETLARLPVCYQANDRSRPALTGSKHVPLARERLGLPEGAFVFCCFNHAAKIGADVFDLWMSLLRDVPGSVLWLLAGPAGAMQRMRARAQARGVSAHRLVFAPRCPAARHLARHAHADLFLDTWPYNAHTTASDALWCGVPVLTRRWPTFAGRVGASLLKAVGLPELITDSDEDYVATARTMARDPGRLLALRHRLATTGREGPLFDAAHHARGLESLYEAMWTRHVHGLPPAPLTATAA